MKLLLGQNFALRMFGIPSQSLTLLRPLHLLHLLPVDGALTTPIVSFSVLKEVALSEAVTSAEPHTNQSDIICLAGE